MVRKMLKRPDVQWASEAQRQGVVAVARAREDTMALLATGSGKTMLLLCAALMEPTCATIIIVPLLALLTDYRRKLDAMGISYQTWETPGDNPQPLSTQANIILVSVDQARKSAFRAAVVDLDPVLPIRRIGIDEAHYGLVADSYRASLRNMYELRFLPVPFVILSGSIPPTSVPALRHALGLQDYAQVLRTTTIRAETQYVIAPAVDEGALLDHIRMLVEFYSGQFRPEDRGLVFVHSRADAHDFAKAIKGACYHGGYDSRYPLYGDASREAAIASWHKGEKTWMACTSAFAAGNDYPSVRVCIYAGKGYDMMETIQAFGRIGRDHRHAIAILVPNLPRPTRPVNRGPADVHKGPGDLWDLAYKRFSGDGNCARFQLTRWVDGQGTCCAADDRFAKCSRCATAPYPPPLCATTHSYSNGLMAVGSDRAGLTPGSKRPSTTLEGFVIEAVRTKRRRYQRLQETNAYIDTFLALLQRYQTSCPFCISFGVEPLEHWHSNREVIKCKTMEQSVPQSSIEEYRTFRSMKYNAGQSKHHKNFCYKCHVPQLDSRLHPQNLRKEKALCEFPDVVGVAWYACFYQPILRAAAEDYFRVTWNHLEHFRSWLKSQAEVGPSVLRGHELFLWWGHAVSQPDMICPPPGKSAEAEVSG